MIEKAKKTSEKLEILYKSFQEQDYTNYINGDIKYNELCEKFNCTPYILDVFFKEKSYIKRSKLRQSSIKETIFNVIDSKESAYILGFYIADGCISSNKFCISLNEKDLELLEQIRDILSPITKITKSKARTNKQGILTNPMVRLSFTSSYICQTLENYGFGTGKTYRSKSIKDIIPLELMWDFIRGYFDGDGCISMSETVKHHITKTGESKIYKHTNIGFTIISKDRTILDEINSFLNNEGIETYVYPDSRNNFLVGTHSLSNIQKIYLNLYNNSLYMKRKREKFDVIMKMSC